ncbi:glycerol kinase [Synchytrium endobioticum]|uniref:Probable glycerol kinase n=1 Tax=Synchytrium endobioticum TaxID=286115 RepID=A0A507D971_9FUNG|nr:glycerol kinase [Synchytrium endobioticum]TPX47905.1 glycerol kinase [Synchytrium endobioticum]
MAKRLLGAIDQGTSSTRFIVFDENGRNIAHHQVEFPQIYPKAGWAEHDPLVILETVNSCIEKTVHKLENSGYRKQDIKGIGITNQRETTVVWDKTTGKPLHNAIVWLDARTSDTVKHLADATPPKRKDYWQPICGLPLSTYFSGVKLRWLLDHVPVVDRAMKDEKLMFGTIDSWLIYNLTGGINGGVHVTDVTNASRTMLMSLKTMTWDDSICKFFGVSKAILPKIVSSAEVYGHMASGSLQGTPICGCLGDQQAALVGQRCFKVGEVKNTYGTGCFVLFNTGPSPVISQHGLLTTVGYQLGQSAPPIYALEGSIQIAGAAIKWLRDNLCIIKDSSEVNELAAQVDDNGGVYFVPAFGGLFAPYWRDDARGTIVGLTQYSTKAHLARATLEAMCFQSREVIDAMNEDSGHALKVLKVDGGASNSDISMQIQADLLGIPVERPNMRESTALGAAIAAGLGVNVWKTIDDIEITDTSDSFVPLIGCEERDAKLTEWKKAVSKSLGWMSPKID